MESVKCTGTQNTVFSYTKQRFLGSPSSANIGNIFFNYVLRFSHIHRGRIYLSFPVSFLILFSNINQPLFRGRDRSVGLVTVGHEVEVWGSILSKRQDLSLHNCVQNGSGAHPASYAISNWGKESGT
jgi:hypothetical protein